MLNLDPETLAADAYAHQDAAAREERRRAALAIQAHDWPAFFAAAAECARAMNARGRIVDQAPTSSSVRYGYQAGDETAAVRRVCTASEEAPTPADSSPPHPPGGRSDTGMAPPGQS